MVYDDNIVELLGIPPYNLNKEKKRKIFDSILNYLVNYHYESCEEYKNILLSLKYKLNNSMNIGMLPFIPVRLFKDYTLKSTNDTSIIKTMTSSGTSGQQVSKIYLDKTTATNQMKVLNKTVAHIIGTKRLPMIIIDSKSILKDRKSFSARGAGILGFSIFGKDIIYALDDNMEVDFNIIKEFLVKHKDKKILIFGFTAIIWEYFYNELEQYSKKLDLHNAILIHGGGWKKMINQSVDDSTFKNKLNEYTGINNIYNYYGMVEQTGSIFVQCKCGYFHTSIFSDIIIRNKTLAIAPNNTKGMVQILSVLPYSYPGHSILTEDEGEIFGEDDCKCGLKGKYFKIYGRIKQAEIRGCSDTYNR